MICKKRSEIKMSCTGILLFLTALCFVEGSSGIQMNAHRMSPTTLHLSCSLSGTDSDSVSFHRKTVKGSVFHKVISILSTSGRCVPYFNNLPGYVKCFCLEHGHVGCNISDISTEYDGDTWKCSIPVDDLRRESNSVEVSSYVSSMGTPATPKQVITTLSASRLTSKSQTTEQFNYTEMDSMTTQDVGTISADMFPRAADIVGPAVTALIVLDIGLILCVFRVKKSTCLRGQRDVRIELPIQEMRRNTINLDVAEGFYTNIVRTTHLGHNPENPEDLHFASRETPVVYSDVAHKKTKQDRNDGGGPV